jgi:diacylglycerol diphosphate phosphatase / phosphatidate phosphatase
MHVLDNRGEVWKTIIVMIPCLAAALVAVSRIMDARHHPFDVITGSMLGVFVAWASYRQYFPPITEPWRKGRAYPIRSWGAEPLGSSGHADLVGTDDFMEPLRNPDEERLDRSGGHASGTADSLHPRPRLRDYHYNRRERGDTWSYSSSEDITDELEMQPRSTRPLDHTPPLSTLPHETDTAYHPPIDPTSQEDGHGA